MPIEKIKKKVESEQPTPEELHDFYDAYYSTDVKVRFNKLKVVNLIRSLGFYRYDIPDSRLSEMVQIKDNKIRLVCLKDIRDAFEDYIKTLPDLPKKFSKKVVDDDGTVTMQPFEFTITPAFLRSKMYDNLAMLFSPDLMERMRPVDDIIIQEDTCDIKYMYFNNTALEITRDGAREVEYKNLTNHIWENSIINRNYQRTSEIGDFEVFVGDICNYNPNEKDKAKLYEGEQRKRSLMSILGYLMHNNYEANLRAILLTDVGIGQSGIASGGTGKGILGKALGLMLNRSFGDVRYIAIPGRSFEFKDTRYSAGDLTTQLIHIEDLNERFSFKDLCNDVTDGCLFRKLHHDPQIHMSKIMLSVNHTIDYIGSTEKRRLIIFELYNYYSDVYTPDMKFSKRFFESKWDERDWSLFDNFMVRCVELYMREGVIQPNMINYENRLIEEKLPADFISYFEDWIRQAIAKQERTELTKQNMWWGFTQNYPDYSKYTRRKFTEWCATYLRLKHIPSAAARKSGNSEDDIIILYPELIEPYSKTEWIYKTPAPAPVK